MRVRKRSTSSFCRFQSGFSASSYYLSSKWRCLNTWRSQRYVLNYHVYPMRRNHCLIVFPLFFLCFSFEFFVLLRSLMTENCIRASMVARLRSQNVLPNMTPPMSRKQCLNLFVHRPPLSAYTILSPHQIQLTC